MQSLLDMKPYTAKNSPSADWSGAAEYPGLPSRSIPVRTLGGVYPPYTTESDEGQVS